MKKNEGKETLQKIKYNNKRKCTCMVPNTDIRMSIGD